MVRDKIREAAGTPMVLDYQQDGDQFFLVAVGALGGPAPVSPRCVCSLHMPCPASSCDTLTAPCGVEMRSCLYLQCLGGPLVYTRCCRLC